MEGGVSGNAIHLWPETVQWTKKKMKDGQEVRTVPFFSWNSYAAGVFLLLLSGGRWYNKRTGIKSDFNRRSV